MMSLLISSPLRFYWPEVAITGFVSVAAAAWAAAPVAIWPLLAGGGVAALAALRHRAVRGEVAHVRLLHREIEHRLSNNLQFISSMLRIAAGREGDEAVQAPLLDAERRVFAMGAVHRLLHRSDAPAPFAIDELAREMLVAAGREDVTLHLDIAATPLPPQTRYLLAMLVTEALTNALKHAFAGRDGGTFTITMEAAGPGRMRLSLCDDGPGWSRDKADARRMGLEIMRGLAHRLDGTLDLQDRPDGGAGVALVFPIEVP